MECNSKEKSLFLLCASHSAMCAQFAAVQAIQIAGCRVHAQNSHSHGYESAGSLECMYQAGGSAGDWLVYS